ncbi:ABC transporter permease [Porphyromonas somerae]|uniref:ABC transporter permease n=1 Tax=Porphyromonas somerae TaxID=322095 RepID=UPI002A7ED1FB|nr:FtsX-like permease family protein [Porphyromonas somerae]MDY3884746.1 FtsX-like permease family protein [Porphyromonas somerae]
MELERTLAEKFLFSESGKYRPAVRVSSIGISLGVSLILLSLFVVRGFKQEVEKKLNNFVGTIRISNPDNNYDAYALPLTIREDLLTELERTSQSTFPEARVEAFIDQMALVKVDSSFRAVMMHGLSEGYDQAFYEEYLVAGRLPDLHKQGELLLSNKVAQFLGLNVGDDFLAYYSNGDRTKVRKYHIVGLIETGFDTFDHSLALTSLSDLQSVNDWSKHQVGGLTVTLKSRSGASQLYDLLFDLLADRSEKYGERYAMFTVEELNYNYFGWLNLLDANVLLILILMIAVAAMTIVTGVVVLILERVRAIATLKALGQRNRSLQKIFWIMASHILLRGILYANAIALALAFLQRQFRVISLDSSQYYMSYVPISIDWWVLLVTNLAVFIVVFLFVLLPTRIIGGINPSRTLRFD